MSADVVAEMMTKLKADWTRQQREVLFQSLEYDLFRSRPVVYTRDTKVHPFAYQFCTGRVLAVETSPGKIEPLTLIDVDFINSLLAGGFWQARYAAPTADERRMYDQRREASVCPTCGYFKSDEMTRLDRLRDDLSLKVHLLLRVEMSHEQEVTLQDEIAAIDAALYPINSSEN